MNISSEQKHEQTCIVIVGMHRSGTSLVASILHKMGLVFGSKLIPAANDNPKGFFEHSDIVALNKELFTTMKIDADGIEKILPATWQSESYIKVYKEKLTAIIKQLAEQANGQTFCIKDPRISLLIPVYEDVLQQLGINLCVVHSQRASFETALSIHKRNEVPVLHALERVVDYERAIDESVKKNPTVVISYNALLRTPEREIEILLSFLNTNNIKHANIPVVEITALIDKSLYHNSKDTHTFLVETIHENDQLKKKLQDSEEKYAAYVSEMESGLIDFVRDAKESSEKEKWWKYKVDEVTELLRQTSQEHANVVAGLRERIVEINKAFKQEQKRVIALHKKNTDIAAAKKKEVSRLSGIISELEYTTNEQNKVIQKQQKTSENYQDVITEKDKEIAHQDGLLSERTNEVANLHTVVTNIERSFTWKAVKAWDMFLIFLFKKDSFVLRTYRKMLGKLQYFINGWLPHKTFLAVKKQVGVKQDAGDFWEAFKKEHGEIDVLFVSHDLTRTGAPRIVFDVAQSFKDTRPIAMACIEKGSMYDDFTDAFGTLIVPEDLYPGLSEVEQVNKVLDAIQPKLVYANSQSAFQFVKQAKKRGIPTIFHIHELEIAFKFFFSKKQLQEFNTYADIFIAVSQPVYDFMVHKLGCNPDTVVLQHAFISRERIAKLAKEIDTKYIAKELALTKNNDGDQPVVIMTVGMFIYRKGADIFMRVAKKIIDKGYNCKFVWIGSKPFKEPFMADFSVYKDYFTFLGEKTNPFPYLSVTDIFALPSREDPFPLVTLEAMSLGKPSVIFKEGGGIHKAVGESGIQVKDFNEDKFEEALIALITDVEKRKQLGAKAVEAQKQYDSTQALPEIHQLIISLLDKSD